MPQFHLNAELLQNLEERTSTAQIQVLITHLSHVCPTCRSVMVAANFPLLHRTSTRVPARHVQAADLQALFSAEADPLALCMLFHQAALCEDCAPEARQLAHLWQAGELAADGRITQLDAQLALSRHQAPALAQALLALPPAARPRAATAEGRFASWGLAEHLCAASLGAVGSDPDEALALADLALMVARRAPLPDVTEDCRQELLMLAHAHRGNALRVAELLTASRLAFDAAEECWQGAEIRWFPYRAEVLSLRMSLETYLRRYEDALDTGAEAFHASFDCVEASRQLRLQCKVLIKRALLHCEMGEAEAGLPVVAQAAALIDPVAEPRLWLAAHQMQLNLLADTGAFELAFTLLPDVEAWATEHGSRPEQLRVCWSKARILAGVARPAEATVALEEVRQGFLSLEMFFLAAVVSLDLAVVLFGQGKLRQVRGLALEMLPVFQEKGIHREALAALAIFQQAAITETVTEGLLAELAAYFRQAQSNPTLAFCGTS